MALLRQCLRELREKRNEWDVPTDAWAETDLHRSEWIGVGEEQLLRPADEHRSSNEAMPKRGLWMNPGPRRQQAR